MSKAGSTGSMWRNIYYSLVNIRTFCFNCCILPDNLNSLDGFYSFMIQIVVNLLYLILKGTDYLSYFCPNSLLMLGSYSKQIYTIKCYPKSKMTIKWIFFIPIWKRLNAGTVPANKEYAAGTVPAKCWVYRQLVPLREQGSPQPGRLLLLWLWLSKVQNDN